ncbi:Outer membrane protein beta-barrel domain-containing protein [Algoriphagus locisalis]|uniref:Outer membrane protein beta-barrel domain-containing protein n=1 Tax=Algoriphagus locisalis TaxID=305507 RepID=A0A1I7CRM6_9BACT|nr:outer membrane beta-barrel protein [Algoriphagus locisalis]SFU02127.1 Outer membrane protein beta-barrel domain-containing protein [Algoriphagus locisalis]
MVKNSNQASSVTRLRFSDKTLANDINVTYHKKYNCLIKFCLSFGLFMSLVTVSQAQVIMSLIFGDKLNNEDNLFGIHLDYSWNNMSLSGAQDPMGSFNLGLFYTHKFDENWHLNLDLMAKYQRGAAGIAPYDLGDPSLNMFYANSEVTRKINYFSIPATMRYAFQGTYFVELGPQISFRLKAQDIFEADLTQGDLTLENDIREEVQRFDFGFVSGVGMYIGKEKVNAFGIRYQGGLSDAMKNIAGKQNHSQIALYANLPIGRGKMKAD